MAESTMTEGKLIRITEDEYAALCNHYDELVEKRNKAKSIKGQRKWQEVLITIANIKSRYNGLMQ